MKKNPPIFIHMLKTGGTTLITTLAGLNWVPQPTYRYRHIFYESLKTNSGDIFEESTHEKYKDEQFILFVRDPFERMLSEYNFLKCREQFMSVFEKRPETFEEYITSEQTRNTMIKFLSGKKLNVFCPLEETASCLRKIMSSFDRLDFSIGRTEEYNTSLNILRQKLHIEVPAQVEIRRATIYKEPIENYAKLKKQFIEHNELDYTLYNHLVSMFLGQKKKYTNPGAVVDYRFVGGKYTYIFTFINNKCILLAFDGNPDFIRAHQKEFDVIHRVAVGKVHPGDGKQYLVEWLKLAIPHFKLEDSVRLNEKNPEKAMVQVAKKL